jgi:ATP-dependent exoDNAse (exonuclease V) beta subunit
MTLHAAKGLEYANVFLVGCEEGLLPHSNSLHNKAELEEERRLMYVGMTRAQKRLVITYALTRYTRGNIQSQMASRFLDSLPREKQWEEKIEKPDDYFTAGEAQPVLSYCEEGDFVQHKKFGRGVVIEVRTNTVVCVFEGYGVQTIDGEAINVSMA